MESNADDEIFNPIESLYEAPELLHGYIQPNSDIYSLGIISIELISGLNEHELWRRVIPNIEEQKCKDIVARCSNELIEIIEKMIDKNLQKRYQTASEAVADLNELKLTKERSFWRKLFS